MKWTMRLLRLIAVVGATIMVFNANGVSVVERDGVLYAPAAGLESEAAIAIKELPSPSLVAACFEHRCAPVENSVRIDGELHVPVLALAAALGARAVFDDDRHSVSFEFAPEQAPQTEAIARVGGLAPELRLVTLEGRSVSLADFRGKRVLINSWASW